MECDHRDMCDENTKFYNHFHKCILNISKQGGGFKYVLFSPLLGEMIQPDGLKPPPSKNSLVLILCGA